MSEKNELLAILCFQSPFREELSGNDLFIFALGSIVFISILLFYYDRIPKSNFKENDTHIEYKTSRWRKLLLYLLIIIPTVTLLIEFFNFGNLFTDFDIFSLITLVTLILYLSITPEIKKVIKRPKLDNPIYQQKDILLNSNSIETNFVIAESKTSTWVKVLAFVLILCVAFTPFQEFLGISLP